jgi:DNA/RNA endonuclease G (NUC1)
MNNIDQSLNLLKDLEVRLKYRENDRAPVRVRTEQDEGPKNR